MASDRPDYLIGDKGVNIVSSPLHTPDGGLLVAQNVEFVREEGVGGIGSRAGIAKLNATALAGPVRSVSNIPLSLYGNTGSGLSANARLMVAVYAGQSPGLPSRWMKSSDALTFTSIETGTDANELTSVVDSTIWLFGSGDRIFTNQMSAQFNRRLYFGGTALASGPMVVWDGVSQYFQFNLPADADGRACIRIGALLVRNGAILIGVKDTTAGPDYPNAYGRVLMYYPSTGGLYQLGDSWGPAGLLKGYPFCLASYVGEVFAGTFGEGQAGDAFVQGNIYRMNPAIDRTWTLDHTSTIGRGFYMSLLEYNGLLFAATSSRTGDTAVIEQRTSLGAWTDSLVAPSANASVFLNLTKFNGLLFAAWWEPGTPSARIYKFDGTSWTLDLNVGASFNVRTPGAAVVFGGALYWSFNNDGNGVFGNGGYLLKRTTAGVWSQVVMTRDDLIGVLQTSFAD